MREVIFIMPALLGGGAERVVTILASYLASQGHPVRICLFKQDKLDYQLPAAVLVDASYVRQEQGLARIWYRLQDLRRLLRKNKQAVFISFFSMFNLYLLAAALGLKRQIIVSERLDPAYSIPAKKWLFGLRKLLYQKASALVFQTPAARDFFPASIRAKGTIIANPLTDSLPVRHQGPRRNTIVSFGRLEDQKNYPLLLEAFALFCQEQPAYQLSIYGKGSCRQSLQEKIQQEGLAGKVILHGFDPHVHEKARDCAMFVLASDYEGLANSMLEAMAMGLPCICTDCPPGGARVFIRHGVNGLLTPVGDAFRLSKAMLQLAADRPKAEAMAQEAEKVRSLLDKDLICAQWQEIIQSWPGSCLGRKTR